MTEVTINHKWYDQSLWGGILQVMNRNGLTNVGDALIYKKEEAGQKKEIIYTRTGDNTVSVNSRKIY